MTRRYRWIVQAPFPRPSAQALAGLIIALVMTGCATSQRLKPVAPSFIAILGAADLSSIDGATLEAAFVDMRANRIPEARVKFFLYLAVNPGDADGLVGAGFAALRDEEGLSDAVRYFSRAVAFYPGYADAFYGLALAFRRLGKPKDAIGNAKTALDLSPDREDFRQLYDSLNQE